MIKISLWIVTDQIIFLIGILPMRFNKVVIAVKFEPAVLSALQEIKKCAIDELTEVHFVHIAPMLTQNSDDEEHEKIKTYILQQLNQVSLDFLPGHEKKVLKCLFSIDSKEAFKDYLLKENADVAVIPVREKIILPRMFEGSFVLFQMRHTSTNILILRDRRSF